MKKLSFQTSLLLAPIAYMIHHYEEHIFFNFRAWRLLYFPDNNPLTTEMVLVILTSITLIYFVLHALLQTRATALSLILFLMASQVQNVFFHVGSSIFFQDPSPGTITAVILYLPVNIMILMAALREQWITPRLIVALFILGGIVYWMFEFVGALPMLSVIPATYLWIAVDWFRSGRAAPRHIRQSPSYISEK